MRLFSWRSLPVPGKQEPWGKDRHGISAAPSRRWRCVAAEKTRGSIHRRQFDFLKNRTVWQRRIVAMFRDSDDAVAKAAKTQTHGLDRRSAQFTVTLGIAGQVQHVFRHVAEWRGQAFILRPCLAECDDSFEAFPECAILHDVAGFRRNCNSCRTMNRVEKHNRKKHALATTKSIGRCIDRKTLWFARHAGVEILDRSRNRARRQLLRGGMETPRSVSLERNVIVGTMQPFRRNGRAVLAHGADCGTLRGARFAPW
jgi:hypothetical protein